MDPAEGSWTVVNEIKVDGSCQPPEELGDEATSQQDEVGKWISKLPNNKGARKSNSYPNATLGPRKWDNKEDGPSSFWHQGQGGGSQLPRASQGNPSPPTARRAIRVSRLDSKPCIPRTAESIVTLLKTPELFPGLREDEIEKWVRVCEHYRDKTCSSEEVGSPEPSNWGKVQGKYPPRQTKATHNQQDTSDVEYRQSPDIHDDLNDAEEKSNPE